MFDPDLVVTDFDRATRVAKIEFPDWSAVTLPNLGTTMGGTQAVTSRLLVGFTDAGDSVQWVRLEVAAGGLTPTTLQRFPWARWLTVADALARSEAKGDSRAVDDAVDSAMGGGSPKRPGRRGHDLAFYEAVRDEYEELRRLGVIAPTKLMARSHNQNRNTVAGWVRRCRQLGLLPPGRPGQAG